MSEPEYRCVCPHCEWSVSGSISHIYKQAIVHTNYEHTIQGWIYRKIRALYPGGGADE